MGWQFIKIKLGTANQDFGDYDYLAPKQAAGRGIDRCGFRLPVWRSNHHRCPILVVFRVFDLFRPLTVSFYTGTRFSRVVSEPSHALTRFSHAASEPSHVLTGFSHAVSEPSHALTGFSRGVSEPSHGVNRVSPAGFGMIRGCCKLSGGGQRMVCHSCRITLIVMPLAILFYAFCGMCGRPKV